MFFIQNSDIHGKGIFTTKKLKPMEKLFLVGDVTKYVQETAELGLAIADAWITRQGRMVNHQKNANCILILKKNCFYLYSKKEIGINEELTCDYSEIPSPPFKNTIEGYKEL